jgi:hypothetical protein
MRKIVSKFEEDKRKRRNQFIVGGILIVVMLISTLAYAFQGQVQNSGGTVTNTTTYNGIPFSNQNGFWITSYSNQRLVFTYFPSQITSDLLNITRGIGDFAGKPVYLFSEDSNSTSELSVNLAGFVSQIVPVQNLSSVDCSKNFIIIEKSLSDSVSQQQNCIFISGQQQDLIALSDNVMFKLFGIKG